MPIFFAANFGELLPVNVAKVNAVQNDFAARRLVHATDNVHQRRLAGAARSHNRNPFALFDREIYPVECADFAAVNH